MSRKLDEELANAIRETDASANEPPASTAGLEVPPTAPKPPPSRSLGLLVTLLVLVGAVVSLVLVGFKEAAIYAIPVHKLLEEKDKLVGRKVRVEGELVPGSLAKRDQPCEYRFTIFTGAMTDVMPVRYPQCVLPDTFRDVPSGGVQVTVEGKLDAQGSFEATLVMAKCTSKYDPSTHQMKDGQLADMPIN